MLAFGIVIIGIGGYDIYQNQLKVIEENLEPTISIENKTEKTILLKVMHKKNISKVEYSWNNAESIVINGNNGKYIEKEITVPGGKNTLHVLVQDENGKEITYDKEYEIESDINLEVSGNKIKISYESGNLISYMTYRWDDEEEKTIDINDTMVETEIDVKKGLHELTIVVVDENNNTDTKVQKISGILKPKVEIDYNYEVTHFIIKASDEEQLVKVEFKLNQDGQTYVLNLEDMDINELEYEVQMELQTGDNLLEVTVYNSNGLSASSESRVRK